MPNESAITQTAESGASTHVRDFANVLRPTSLQVPDREGAATTVRGKTPQTTVQAPDSKNVHSRETDEKEKERLERKFQPMTEGDWGIAVHNTLNALQPSGLDARAEFFNDTEIKNLVRVFLELTNQPAFQEQHEVRIQLPDSICKGLTVKIVIDKTGSVSAEFISLEAGVRRQLDLRLPDLTELMRSRGLNILSLKTSDGSDSSGQTGTEEKRSLSNPVEIEGKQRNVNSQVGETVDCSVNDLTPTAICVYRA